MTALQPSRYLLYAFVASSFGLFGAGVPKLLGEHQDFSWAGFLIGAGLTVVAVAVVRLFSRAEQSHTKFTFMQTRLMGLGATLFAATLFLFALAIHTDWQWPRKLVIATIIGGGVTYLVLLASTLGPQREA